jgi:hypothetical protein
MAVRLSGLPAGHNVPTGRFLVLISVRDRVDPRAIVRREGLGKLKKSNDLIENRNRDLPACSIVPQPTTLPRATNIWSVISLQIHVLIQFQVSNVLKPDNKYGSKVN